MRVRFLAVVILVVSLSHAARADDTAACPNACLCKDAAVPPTCGDEKDCKAFCTDHDGVAPSHHHGYNLKPPPAKKKQQPDAAKLITDF